MASLPLPPQPSAAESNNTKGTNTNNIPSDDDDDVYFSTLESIMRVTVAGFGGALAGLSLARRGGTGAAAAGRQATSALAKATTTNAKSSSKDIATKISSSGGASVKSNSSSRGGGGTNTIKRLPRQRPILRSTPPSTKPYVDGDLPYAWAVACTAFAGIIETTRVFSPTSLVGTLARGEWEFKIGDVNDDPRNNRNSNTDSDNDNDNDNDNDSDKTDLENDNVPSSSSSSSSSLQLTELGLASSLTTISDYVIGGAIAGALFRGSAVRTQVGRRIDASILGVSAPSSKLSSIKARPLSGILPGAALGLVAGVAYVAMDHAQVFVEDYFGELDDGDGNANEETELESREMGSPIPADIKAMSNEELMKSIENLKKGKSESHDENGDDGQAGLSSEDSSGTSMQYTGEAKNEGKVHDLISAAGFRPHPSQ